MFHFTVVQVWIAPGRHSEDCLYLSIARPVSRRMERIPVVVWLYGGSFYSGSLVLPLYDPAILAGEKKVDCAVCSTGDADMFPSAGQDASQLMASHVRPFPRALRYNYLIPTFLYIFYIPCLQYLVQPGTTSNNASSKLYSVCKLMDSQLITPSENQRKLACADGKWDVF